jgi:hypothetical protein
MLWVLIVTKNMLLLKLFKRSFFCSIGYNILLYLLYPKPFENHHGHGVHVLTLALLVQENGLVEQLNKAGCFVAVITPGEQSVSCLFPGSTIWVE